MFDWKTTAVICIATRHYLDYWHDLVKSFEKLNINTNFYLFSDDLISLEKIRTTFPNQVINVIEIQSLGWPLASLLRYELIASIEKGITEEFVIYLDADMLMKKDFSDVVSPNTLTNGIALVAHPGFWRPKKNTTKFYFNHPELFIKDLYLRIFSGGIGSWEKRKASHSFVRRKLRDNYYCGGTWMGVNEDFFSMVRSLENSVQCDINNNVMAIWHDESHLNKWATQNSHSILDPGFCYAQEFNHLSGLTQYIQAVKKLEGK